MTRYWPTPATTASGRTCWFARRWAARASSRRGEADRRGRGRRATGEGGWRTGSLKKKYGQRWQVESLFSQDKRRFGSQLSASTINGQFGELCLRVLAHNIALLLRRRIQQAPKPA
ncbi:MAG: transposase [Planctomycetes bacterium]|nr:transposase [Planctomycetota bacterium]